MVMVQAMALGKPIIITRTPTVEDYVTEGIDALLYEPGNAEDLRRTILRLMEDDELRYQLSKNALEAYEARHSMRVFVHSMMSEIRQVIDGTLQEA
jgi:glycosyltransferase involved in cell wall biosynthesis